MKMKVCLDEKCGFANDLLKYAHGMEKLVPRLLNRDKVSSEGGAGTCKFVQIRALAKQIGRLLVPLHQRVCPPDECLPLGGQVSALSQCRLSY
jgi:hypothetical protein